MIQLRDNNDVIPMALINDLFKSLSDIFVDGLTVPEDAQSLAERTANRGRLSSLINADNQSAPSTHEPVIINGIALPQTVIDQLRQHGFNPEWCTRCELQAAEQEVLVDGTVFHDPDGNNFFDDLELTEEEIEEENGEIDPPPYRTNLHVRPDEDHAPDHGKIFPVMSFYEIERKRRKEKSNHANDDGSHNAESHGAP